MTTPTFPAAALDLLARRVVHGGVVFFIGSGFSIDSEGNSAKRLVGRLLVRLLAAADVLEGRGVPASAETVDDLRATFGLKEHPKPTALFRFTSDQLDTLSSRYYETNDWFCVAYGRLLQLIGQAPEASWTDVLDAISAREEEIRSKTSGPGKVLNDAVPLTGIHPALIRLANSDARLAGKALFLDTMGFRDCRVMGGEPTLSDPNAVMQSYGTTLLPRHHVIARLAREGFCGTTITANFDLLLEGAFRVAGFTAAVTDDKVSPPTHHEHFARIASPLDFFRQGKAHRSAILLKMHGCAEQYRSIAADAFEAIKAYLPSMVFTYREIQNWRQDWWAADYLRTLLRTRTVVFCGYSLQDPVVHDTFRTVYEDMSKTVAVEGPKKPREASEAPAFFLAPGVRNRREFHGMEVLQAASRAVATEMPRFNDHPNYLRFHFRGQPQFPDLDEQLQWLAHQVFRQRQHECLEAFLHRSVTGLLRQPGQPARPRPDAELATVRESFRILRETESVRAHKWSEDDNSRREHGAICGWTAQFHAGLLREFATIEMVQAQQAPSAELSRMRRLPWYYPTTAAAGWTCWGAVVELALRNMIAAVWKDIKKVPPAIRAAESLAPTILFSPPPESDEDLETALAAPIALAIRFRGLDRTGEEPKIFGSPARTVCWELHHGDAPWPVEPDKPAAIKGTRQRLRVRAPSAHTIWNWAAMTPQRTMNDSLRRALGIAGTTP